MSVNSFGYGGTNAHAILEAYDQMPVADGLVNGNGVVHTPTTNGINGTSHEKDAEQRLVVLSANSELSLNDLVSKMRQWLVSDQGQSTSFADLTYTLNVRRSKLPWRCSVIARDSKELELGLGDSRLRPVKSARDTALAFVFTGQGAQWFGMGRELLTSSQEFASSIALCNQVMKALGCDWDLIEELSRDKESSRISESRFSQPSTTAVQIALVDLLATYDIRPEAVCGHSSGEIAAAYAAGALNREAAMQAAYMRGIFSAEAKSLNTTVGTMLAVGEGEEAINKRIKDLKNGKVTVACVNSPESTTISGDLAAILELQTALDAASVFNRRLKVDSAYHSHHMKVVAEPYLSSLRDMAHGTPREGIAFYSSVTGSRKRSDFGPSYWVSNLVSQVKFSAAAGLVAEHMSAAHSTANNMVIEVGPHSALAGPLRQLFSNLKLASGADFKYNYLSCLVRNESAVTTVLALAGKAFELGCSVRLEPVLSLGQKDVSLSSRSRCRVVDSLPRYPWDHSTTYWHESRYSKQYRMRPFPPHDLLGLFDPLSSPYEPRWKYRVSLQTLPWLQDHIVENFVIFPGAGYVAMVIEAMKQLLQLRKVPGRLRSINFRDITFAKPIVIHNDGSKSREVEMQLIISPSRQHVGSSWENFHVLSYDSQNESWIDNCTGMVSWDLADADTQADELVGVRDDGLGPLTGRAADKWLQDIQAGCPVSVDAAKTYEDLKKSGNEYGPSFQGLKEIHVGKNSGFAKVTIGDIMEQMPGQYMQPHTIHPTVFDSIIQIIAVLFRQECSIAPMMPVLVGELSVAVDMDTTPGTEIFTALRLSPQSRREAGADLCAYQRQSDGTFRPVLTGNRIQSQAVGDSGDDTPKKATFRMEWKSDVDFITQGDFMDHISRNKLFDINYGTVSEEPAEAQLRLNDTVATIFIRRAVQRIQKEGISTACNPHLTKLLNWMFKWDASKAGRFLDGLTPEDEVRLIDQASRSNIFGAALTRLGQQYLEIITGKADSLELLVQDNLLGRLYAEYTLWQCHYAQMAEYMQTLVHKNPYMKILEIGAGTGGATMPLMERMERDDRLLVEKYTYTDISSGFFERARNKFSKWSGQIDFKTLDISRDPLTQGYAAHSFDLIVASIVLHATPLMDVTMANVRKLLKPGGRLVLMELTAVTAAQNGIFGTLEGWWMSEDGRQDGPLLSVPEWDACLKRHGFSGTDLAIPAHLGESSDVSTMIVARALETANAGAQMAASIHLGHSDASQAALGEKIRYSLAEQGIRCSQESWGPVDPSKLAIIVDSAENPLLLDPSQESFDHFKQLLLQGNNILWVSFQHSKPTGETAAMKNMVNGMARVVRGENPGLRLVTIDVQDQIQSTESDKLGHIIHTVTEIAVSSFWAPESVRAQENEYTIRDGKSTIPRVVPDDRFASYINSLNPSQNKDSTSLVECKYLDTKRTLVFDIQVPGLLDTIRFVDNDKLSEPLGADQIEVRAEAHGVNPRDVSVALGQMAPGTEMCGEVAGVITAVGSNIQSWKLGDRVLGLMAAPFGNLVRLGNGGAGLVAIPDSITSVDAASLAYVYNTAWYCLNHIARLEKGQTVLIHSASGDVGQAAIQLSKLAEAEIFATVGSTAEKQLITEQYGIPEDHIFSSRSGNFKKHVMNATQNNGVDVVLNSLSGQLLMDSWDCVAQFGTFIEIGKTDITGRSQLNMANFEKQATFAAVDIAHLYGKRPQHFKRALTEVFDLFNQGLLKSVHPVETYPMSSIEEVFRLIAAKHVGKLVLVADEHTLVKATKPKAPALRLRRDGTYVIAGGVGDLGKRMGCFLAEKGAGHIVALTRRNLDAQQRAPLEKAVSESGGILHIVQCDIGDEKSTYAAAEQIAARLPPIRGVIQSALVLRDHPLEYMELDDWTTAMKPKVHGTLNAHSAFCTPETTEFFIMLSSVASTLGSNSQSNYAAGNAFQDAFAHAQAQYSEGSSITNYTTINVGAVEGSEQISRVLDQKREILDVVGSVSFDEVFATLEYAMGPQSRADKAIQCLMHFNRDKMEDTMGDSALSDHMYDHVPSRRRRGDATSSGAVDNKKANASQAVEQAESIAEAEDIVKEAVIEKFTAFIGDDVPEDQPISALGLDSLVSIELKNWIKHTFHIPLQTSELSGAPSVVGLVKLMVSRMDLKCKANGAAAELSSEEIPSNGADASAKPSHGLECCKAQQEVPAQPLPDLDDILDFWLEANEHLFSPQELAPVYEDFQMMRAPGSPARQILETLYKTYGQDKSNGWFNDIVTEGRFLCSRGPIAPYASILGGHRFNGKPHSQAERAAILTTAALSFKRSMDAGEVEPLDIGGRPECTWRWGWMFSSARVPHLGCDKMVSYASENIMDHIAVLRKGRVFKVMLQYEDGRDVPFQQLRATFDTIVAQVEGDDVWSGILTTDERDSWAKVSRPLSPQKWLLYTISWLRTNICGLQTRETLSTLSPGNAEYFQVLDSALFVLCLDAGSPETPEQIARQAYIGDGANRWFDKVLQFYVSANGRSGQITEHGMIDGTTPGRLIEWLAAGMANYSAEASVLNGQLNGDHSSQVELKEVVLETTPEIERHMVILRKRFKQNTSASTYVREQLDEFGTDFLVKSRAPVKGVIDLTFQLAIRLFFGESMLSWEPTSGAHFHKGRADALQRASPAVNAFCDAAAELSEGQGHNVAQVKALLLAATKQMNIGMQTVLSGRSYLRVFEVLSYLWPTGGSIPKPRFLSEVVFFGRPRPPIFFQSNSIDAEVIVEDFVQLIANPDGFWSMMVPEKNT